MLFIGNVIALIGCCFAVFAGYTKSGKTLLYQSISLGFLALANLILGGVTGFIINFISITRNILQQKGKLTKPAKIIILIAIVCSCFKNFKYYNLLVLSSVGIYTALLTSDEKKLKLLIACTTLPWIGYDFLIQNYVSCCFDSAAVVASISSFLKLRKTTPN